MKGYPYIDTKTAVWIPNICIDLFEGQKGDDVPEGGINVFHYFKLMFYVLHDELDILQSSASLAPVPKSTPSNTDLCVH